MLVFEREINLSKTSSVTSLTQMVLSISHGERIMYKGVMIVVVVLLLISLVAGCVSAFGTTQAEHKPKQTVECVQVNDTTVECVGVQYP